MMLVVLLVVVVGSGVDLFVNLFVFYHHVVEVI